MSTNFIYVYFNFTYFLLLSPYRFRKSKLGNFDLVEWFPQKVKTKSLFIIAQLKAFMLNHFSKTKGYLYINLQIFCAINTFLAITVYISKTCLGFKFMTIDNLVSILTVFEFVFCLICKSLLFLSIWIKKNEVLTILNSNICDPYLKSLNKYKWNYLVPFISSWLMVFVVVSSHF